jgi:uncharacterized protein YjaZ
MDRHIVTNDPRTFQQLAHALAVQGIQIDHFHAVVVTNDQEQRFHLNKQADGSFQPKRGVAPSQQISDYQSVIADEWHHR